MKYPVKNIAVWTDTCIVINKTQYGKSRSQCPRGLRRGSAAVRLLGLWVRIPPGAWMSVCCECCVLSGRGLCVGWSLVQRSPTECGVSERERERERKKERERECVCVWSWILENEEALAQWGPLHHGKKIWREMCNKINLWTPWTVNCQFPHFQTNVAVCCQSELC
jgi:hypothetical protein